MDVLNDFDVWLSQWGTAPTFSGNIGMWQYSSLGSVSGISGDVGMDISYKNYPYIISQSGLNKGDGSANSSGSKVVYYTVVSGDTLWGIAEKFLSSGYKYNEIVALNGLTGDTIYPGQILKIPSSSGGPLKTYTVVSGDTLWGIAEKFIGSGSKYGLIMDLNGLTSDVIYPGQVLKIPNA